jgi:hypothetical protein
VRSCQPHDQPAQLPGGWRKSSYSGSGNNCVEVASTGHGALVVRDSKTQGETLTFTVREWRAFTEAMKAGKFSLS